MIIGVKVKVAAGIAAGFLVGVAVGGMGNHDTAASASSSAAVQTAPQHEAAKPPAVVAAPPARTYEISAPDLLRLYEKNEVAADELLKGGAVRITGRVQSIQKDFLGDIALTLVTQDRSNPVRSSLGKAEIQAAAQLQRGQLVAISCAGIRFILGSPVASDCKLQ